MAINEVWHYIKATKPALLADELEAAIPNMRPVNNQSVYNLYATPTDVWITIPANVHKSDLDPVVAAHNPANLSINELQTQNYLATIGTFNTAYNQAVNTLDQMQANLAGTPTNAVVLQAVRDLSQIVEGTLKMLKFFVKNATG